MRRWWASFLVATWAAAGCSDDAATVEADTFRADVVPETTATDTVVTTPETKPADDTFTADDAAVDSDERNDSDSTGPDTELDTGLDTGPDTGVDTGPEEVTPSVPLPGFGTISGDCGVLDDELLSDAPSIFFNRIDFGTDPYDDADLSLLTAGAQQIKADGNAGGSSIRSEMFTFEILTRCELATLVKTENHVIYDDPQSKKTDMVLMIDGLKIASNPTRAIGFPFDAPYTEAQAKTILEKKLGDINESTQFVSAADRWEKQILLVFAYSDAHVTPIQSAYDKISAELKSDTIVIVTVTDGADTWIYSDNN